MKIGIITKIGKNFGAVLQAYALKKKLCDMGHEAHVIRFTPKISVKSYKVCRFPWRFRGAVSNVKSLLHFKAHKLSSKRFLEFREKNYDFIGEYFCDEQIESNSPDCDVYITGSDQVWNPKISFDRTFYCMFANGKQNVRTASYAASIGLRKIPEVYKNDFKARVEKIDFVSVRESRACEILNEMGIDSRIAPDPTLLLTKEEWDCVAKETVKSPYILCYFVALPDGVEQIVKSVKEKLGLTVVNLMYSEESSKIGDVKIRDAGPEEFLGLFKNASFVITSSFHGTVFSIINTKPFMTAVYSQTGSRVWELLSTMGLENRIFDSSCEDVTPFVEGNIDFNELNNRLIMLREYGGKILEDIAGEK